MVHETFWIGGGYFLPSIKRLKPFDVPGTFLDNNSNPSFDEADACVLGIAFDATASYNKGAWFGPQAIMAASHQIEFEAPSFGVSLTEKVNIHSLGLLEYPRQIEKGVWKKWSGKKIESLCEEMVSEVKQATVNVLKEKKLFVGFGGEHSTCNGIFQAIADTHPPKDVTLIHLDAHLDLRDALEGLKYSHGSVIRRGLELGFESVHLGIRDHISKGEAAFIQKQGFGKNIFPCATMPLEYYPKKQSVFDSSNQLTNGQFSKENTQKILQKIKTRFAYLTIDVDAFDPVFFPGTGTPLPFGLDFFSTQTFLYRLVDYLKKNNIRLLGFDIQEVAPQLRRPVDEYSALETISTQTEMNAALLAYKLLLWIFLERFVPEKRGASRGTKSEGKKTF